MTDTDRNKARYNKRKNSKGLIDFNLIVHDKASYVKYTVNISGVEYSIEFLSAREFIKLPESENSVGLCDTEFKKIYIHNMDNSSINPAKKIIRLKSNLRHELIHAFIYESGLDMYTNPLFQEGWAVDEEAVDWFANKIPQITELFNRLGILK